MNERRGRRRRRGALKAIALAVAAGLGIGCATLALSDGELAPLARTVHLAQAIAPAQPPASPTLPTPAPLAAMPVPVPGPIPARMPALTHRIIAVGDVMIGSDWPEPYLDPRVVAGGDAAQVIGPELAALLHQGDIVFGNFEGTMHARDTGAKQCANPKLCFTFRSPPAYARYLRAAGFTMMSNANNHARDFGPDAQAETVRRLREAGITVSAADAEGMRIGRATLPDGTRVALAAFGHNLGLMRVQDLDRVRAIVGEARAGANITIVSCHIGGEGANYQHVTRQEERFIGEDRGNPYAFARAAIDAGASAVLCHGPHVPRAIDVYRGHLIAYSLGNFWTYGTFNLSGPSGLATLLDIELDRQGMLVAARIVSARQTRPGGPAFDPSGAAAAQIARLTAQDVPEAGISVAADGTVSWPH